MFLDTAIVGAAGGLTAELTGGKFENGFVTAAFANMYNKWTYRSHGPNEDPSYEWEGPPDYEGLFRRSDSLFQRWI